MKKKVISRVKKRGPHQFAEILERLNRMIRAAERAEGLTPVEWECLRYMGRANRFSRFSIAASEYLSIPEKLVKQTLSSLLQKRLIRANNSSIVPGKDHFDLTSQGAAMLRGDPLIWIAFDISGSRGHDHAYDALEAVLNHLLAEYNGRAFGTCETCANYELSRDHGAGCRIFSVALSKQDRTKICWEFEEGAAAKF